LTDEEGSPLLSSAMTTREQDRGLSRRQFITVVTGGLAVPVAGAVGALSGGGSKEALAQPGPAPTPPTAGPIQIALASTRTQLTTAEPVELALAYSGTAERLALRVRHEDGSEIAAQVRVDRTRGQIVSFPPGMLKPGTYGVFATDGKNAPPPIHVAIHRDDHPSAYFVAAWMQATADAATAAAKGGWMYFTSDLVVAGVRKPSEGDVMNRYVAARMRPYPMTVIGGGHQLDLDPTNDWGDPWVQRAVTWKMGLAALSNRIYPAEGLQVFDEPGLTWWPFRDADGGMRGLNPFAIPAQLEEFRRLTGNELPSGPIAETLPRYAGMVGPFIDFVAMRLKYLEQAWWAAVTAVSQVHAPFVTINQVACSYAPGWVRDGVDNRMNRPYRVISGHGGYSQDVGCWGPVISARACDGWSWDRPHYFLPMWGNHDYARMRQEVWLPWSTKLEGIQYDPNHTWSLAGGHVDATTVLELAEVNRRLALVGDIMRRMPRTLAPVAVLMSHSQYAHDVAMGAESMGNEPSCGHRAQVTVTMWRALSTGIAPNWIDEHEVVAKGAAFLRQWKVVYCPGLAIANPELRDALERYVAAGGRLVQGEGDSLALAGSTRVAYAYPPPAEEGQLQNDYAKRKRRMDLAPGFARDLKDWIGRQEYASDAPPDAMLMSVQRAGDATYLLIANCSQDPEDTRRSQMAPVPLETTIEVPAQGALYDLLEGGTIAVQDGKAPLHLAAGDGACWLHLPAPPGALKLTVEPAPGAWALDVRVTWGTAGYLPFRLRLFDPAGTLALELFRATTPWDSVPLSYGESGEHSENVGGPAEPHGDAKHPREIGVTSFKHRIALGANASPGTWTVEAHESLTGSRTTAQAVVRAGADTTSEAVTSSASPVSVYFDDARKIIDLFAGRAYEPPYEKMNWDCRRVFGLDSKRFAVFGPAAPAEQVATALRAKGMTVAVNPPYEIVPFTREPDHGGTGPVVDNGKANFENVYAHTIVLPGHALGQRSWERGHINRPVTATFPGPGRAYVQWGIGGYQAGFENVWVFGDAAAGVSWLLAAVDGANVAAPANRVSAVTRPAIPARARLARRFTVTQELKLADTPTGIGSSPDGKVIYVLLAGGSVAAYDHKGRRIWSTPALLDGACLAVSPRGDRLAVGGFPGLLVLDTANGKVLGGYREDPPRRGESHGSSGMVACAWSPDGTVVAGGGASHGTTSIKGATAPVLPLAILDAQGKRLPSPAGISGDVMGMAFVPRTSTLLVGADALTLLEVTTGRILWKCDIGRAKSVCFDADGKTAAAGGWGKRAGSFSLSDGKVLAAAAFPSNVGGVALLPGGALAVAVWGGTHPLYRLGAKEPKPATMAQGRFAFHDVLWLEHERGVVAAEQGGDLWLFDAHGEARAKLEDAGTTVNRMMAQGTELLVGRMNRAVQRLALG
jgi:hypothetical protein